MKTLTKQGSICDAPCFEGYFGFYPLRRRSCHFLSVFKKSGWLIYYVLSHPDTPKPTDTHVYKWTDVKRQIERLTVRPTYRWFKRLPDRYALSSSRQTGGHTLSVDSTHLPALKHFNHLTANYSGARQNRTETLHFPGTRRWPCRLDLHCLSSHNSSTQLALFPSDMGEKAIE